jgi:ubiquinone/menaquinone biosynthesis C-methylase UbiE
MTIRTDTLFERFLSPILSRFIDRDALTQLRHSIDWQADGDRLTDPTVCYPDYYTSQPFHGIEGGYLTAEAAVTYDAITQYVLPPSEAIVRQGLLNRIQSHPRRILDLGCGTGSTTVLLKQAFPNAEVIGLDLSPYMLVMAERKARDAHLDIRFRHGLAEATGFVDTSFDLVTASLLFHELPTTVSQAVLREAQRLLSVGGELLILDGRQQTLTDVPWLTDIFEEPYIRDYAAGNLDEWMQAANFGAVQTESLWWMHQVTRGVKAIAASPPKTSSWEPKQSPERNGWTGADGTLAPA